MSSPKTKIVLADDHEIFRKGFKRVLESRQLNQYEFVGEASNGVELVEKVNQTQPDIVITDIRMPVMDGIKACRNITNKFPLVKVIAFSAFDNENYIMEMIHAGAKGYLVKNATIDEISDAIATVKSGKSFYCSTISEKLFGTFENSINNELKIIHFALYEINVIRLICKQYTNKEIASNLKLSTRTVEEYRRCIQDKIKAKNAVGIALYAIINGIVKTSEL